MTDLEKLAEQEKIRIENIRKRIRALTEEIQQKKEGISAQMLNIKPDVSTTSSSGIVSPSMFSEIQNMLLETITKGYETIIQEKEKIIQKLQKEIDSVMEKYQQLKLTQEQQIARVTMLSTQQDKSLVDMVKKLAELEQENRQLKIKLQEFEQQSKLITESLQQDKILYVKSHFDLLTTTASECLRYFRTPLGIISEAFEMVKEDIDGHPAHKKISVLQQEIFKIRDILNAVIQRLQLPSVVLQEVNIKSVISAVLSKFQPEFTKYNVEVVQEIPQADEKDFIVKTDFQILQDIISEIITNSIEAFVSPTRNKIVIRINITGSTVVLTIEDNGHGIPEHLLPKVTSLFFTTKFEQGHFGLGLFKVEWLLKMFDGKITINSVFNQGTTVSITLPRSL